MSPPSPRIVKATVTPVLISDPPLLNCLGVHQPYTPRAIIEVVTDDGLTGVGETYGDSEYLTVASSLAHAIIGHPLAAWNSLEKWIREAVDLREYTAIEIDPGGLRGARTDLKLVKSVVAGFEVAMLDALGRTICLPVHAILGGKVRDAVEYSGYLFYCWAEHPMRGAPQANWPAAVDASGIVGQAREFRESYGFSSFKLKGGVFAPEEDIAAICALSEQFPGHALRLDPNGAWSVRSSLLVANELRDVVEYLEDPTMGVEGMAQVHRETGVPLATNMVVTSVDELRPAFDANAVQVVLSDHHYWGGLQASRDLAAVCRAYGVGLSMHSNTHLGISLAAMTQVASVLSDLQYACDTHRPWQVEDVITTPHTFVDGSVAVSDLPGLGVELDRDELARLHERWIKKPEYHSRDDVAAMKVARRDWVKPTLPRW